MPVAITRPNQKNGTGAVNALAIEKFNGKVALAYQKASRMEQFLSVEKLTGTDTLSTDALGQPGLQVVVAGDTPSVSTVKRGRTSVTVNTVILSRVAFAMLDQVQDAINTRDRIPAEQGKVLGRHFDRATQVMAVKAALASANSFGITGGDNFPAGNSITMTTALDELDPDKLLKAIEQLVIKIEKKEVEIQDMRLFLPVDQYYTLLNNDKLINRDYGQGGGDYASGKVVKAFDLPIEKSWTLPSAVDASPLMGADYEITAQMAKCKGLLMTKDALLCARAIELTSLTHYDPITLLHYVDSYYAFGCAPYQVAEAGVLLSA